MSELRRVACIQRGTGVRRIIGPECDKGNVLGVEEAHLLYTSYIVAIVPYIIYGFFMHLTPRY
jgi:hypothetical protein